MSSIIMPASGNGAQENTLSSALEMVTRQLEMLSNWQQVQRGNLAQDVKNGISEIMGSNITSIVNALLPFTKTSPEEQENFSFTLLRQACKSLGFSSESIKTLFDRIGEGRAEAHMVVSCLHSPAYRWDIVVSNDRNEDAIARAKSLYSFPLEDFPSYIAANEEADYE